MQDNRSGVIGAIIRHYTYPDRFPIGLGCREAAMTDLLQLSMQAALLCAETLRRARIFFGFEVAWYP